ncbi:hypothetical protein K7X08_000505 [Anisodus acutangulus]|uniref:Uncharacterized protein n=1 Tax=Anisodus acutangulus TaxID=402998 RepID=A0A9Q1M4X3_9SOLA|nr:hypothetical protein K7X08_000505 [Anisodus acutangulus]
MEIIFTKIHYGGTFSDTPVPTYVGECVPALRSLNGVGKGVKVVDEGVGEAVNLAEESAGQASNLDEERGGGKVANLDEEGGGQAANVDEEGIGNANLNEEASNLVDVNVDSDGNISNYVSSNSDLGEIPPEDGSNVDEELRAFIQERRSKKRRKMMLQLKKYQLERLVV